MGWSVETSVQCWGDLSNYEKAHWIAYIEIYNEDFEARREEADTPNKNKSKGKNVKRVSRPLPHERVIR